ncbi:GNAT family N-acetyltransferase [Haladaptatus pallidirubidus]|uniref:GNAT family N-acetyltransferase n=1 Tax=Haladaptatus pallidirubidus TaxID=1008152 RepID=UPI0035EFE8EB
METRDVTASDIPAIRRVSSEAVNAAYEFLPEKEREATVRERFSDQRLQTALGDDDVILIAAVSDGELVGYAHVEAISRVDAVGEAALRGIYVVPNRWQTGVGTALLKPWKKRFTNGDSRSYRLRFSSTTDERNSSSNRTGSSA